MPQTKMSLLKRFFQSYSLNNLGYIWYCVLATCLQIYIITKNIYRFTAYISLPWPNGNAPQSSINSYMMYIGASIILMPFFIIVALMKIGNYSNDNHKLGIFAINRYIRSLSREESRVPLKRHWLRLIWKHLLPIAPLLHLLISFCFLFPRLITNAQLIRHGFLNKADIWKTDLDFILNRLNGKRFNFFGMIQTINTTEHRSIYSETATLGQYFIRNSKSLSETFYELDENGKISLEFVNFLFALLMITARYPSVFWHTNKIFSLIFSLQLMFNMLQSVIALSAFQVAFKVFVCDPTHLLIKFRESSSLSLTQLSVLFCFYFVCLHLSSISLYFYGIQKYREFRYARTKYFQDKYESTTAINFLPFLFAMLFFLLLALSIGPLFYEFVIIYCGSLNSSALLIMISTILYFTFWIILWVGLATKSQWSFTFDDFETDDLLSKTDLPSQSELVIVHGSKILKVKDAIAKQAIINFVNSNNLNAKRHFDNEENTVNMQLDSYQGVTNENYCKSLNRNFRHSSRSYRKINSFEKSAASNQSDSEGEYTTFYRLKRSYSLNQKNARRNTEVKSKNKHMSNNLAYGLMRHQPSAGNTLHDKCSDTSSGIHSNSSHSSIEFDEKPLARSNSLESLMQRLEAAKAEEPTLKSLSTLKQYGESKRDLKSPHVALTTFSVENNIYGTNFANSLNCNQSKLIDFTENPDYSKYYLPQITIQ